MPAFYQLDFFVANDVTRIFSDIHYGDRSSQVKTLDQLAPLLDGPARIVLNGDTMDTRMGPYPALTARLRAEVFDFFGRARAKVTFITGNHDPDISDLHSLDLCDGNVVVTHGDVLYDKVVPWGRDGSIIAPRIAAARAALPPSERGTLEAELKIFRHVCAGMPQRHQAERNFWKFLLSFTADTFWPPQRIINILHVWRDSPRRAARLATQHRPRAKVIMVGHYHRHGIWQPIASGPIVINTGSFCRPLGGCVVDISADRLTVRRIVRRGREFCVGRAIAEIALAPTAGSLHHIA